MALKEFLGIKREQDVTFIYKIQGLICVFPSRSVLDSWG